MNDTAFKPGQQVGGYRVRQVSSLPSINAWLIQLEHTATRTTHIHISNQDRENTFGVFFRTVPEDSTGVAHILEHTVLCGSEKYKVRDPFFSMIKRSLSTFMNAFTASDWTMYPFSTQNEKDYYNLMDVYLDAAFFPNIDDLSFKQEGHRLELTEGDDGVRVLEYKGVVYNEMKGAMSSPSQVLSRALLKGLYPDTTYSNNSGGEPSDIPRLTLQGLKDFHAKYYHPSNAFFYTYGNLDLEQTLSFIEKKVLSRFGFLEMDTMVPSQPRWTSPRTMTQPYAYADPEDLKNKYQSCVAWLTSDVTHTFDTLVLTVLEQILLGNSASPLRKALIDSNLGSALADVTGFDADNRDTMFVCGLKDIAKDAVPKVEKLIFDTLGDLIQNRIEKPLIDSAIHQIEFYRKEITNTPYPYGIKLLLSIAGTVIHGGNPADAINIDHDLSTLQNKIAQGPFLEQEIQRLFLDNPHCLRFILEPDPNLEATAAEQVQEELKAILARLSPEELKQIQEDAKALEALQETEDDPEILPTLALSDVPREIEIIHPDKVPGTAIAACYDKATCDILYFTCPVGGGNVPAELFPMAPFFCKAFTNAGTARSSYEKIANLMDLYTGGISMTPFSGSYFSQGGGSHSFFALQGKALERNIDPLFDLVDEFINGFGFSDHERLKNLLLQYQAAMESSIVSSGHRYAISLSARHLSRASFINELWHGIAQFKAIKKITPGLADNSGAEKTLAGLENNLTAMARSLLRKDNFRPAVIGEAAALVRADKRIRQIHDSLENGSSKAFFTPDIAWDNQPPHEGWFTNTAVSFVGQSFKTVRITHPDSPGLAVASKLLRSLFLHKEIREKGGAYGGFAVYNTEEGIFSFGSYRDPHIKRTLDVYQDACQFIVGGKYGATDVKEAILQVCSDIDKPETPGPAAMKAFYRDITQLSDDIRKKFKDELLGLDKEKVQRIAETYFTDSSLSKGVAVISSQTLLEQANQALEADNLQPLSLKKI